MMAKELMLKDSRHPVIERNLPVGESYISNDIELNDSTQQIIILTGPNMSGKSAILRQTALICLMAHMGSFVPRLLPVYHLRIKFLPVLVLPIT
jgi:DNA mismatch repair protein MutS